MYKCKQNLNPPVFRNIFMHRTKTKHALRNKNSIQEPLKFFLPKKFWSVLYFIPWTVSLEQTSNFKKINLTQVSTFSQ